MRDYGSCVQIVADQINHWFRIGKIETYDRDMVEELMEEMLTEDELWEYQSNDTYWYGQSMVADIMNTIDGGF